MITIELFLYNYYKNLEIGIFFSKSTKAQGHLKY